MVIYRLPTGIKGLDDLLGGGLRAGSVCILTGQAMSGRELLAQEYFFRGLREEEGVIYVTTKNFTEEIMEDMAEMNWVLDTARGQYVFIDAYSPQSDPTLQDSPTIKYVSSVTDFAKLSNVIMTTMSNFNSEGISSQRIAFDSVDALLMFVSPSATYRFLSYLRAKIKAFKATAFFLLQPELHDEKAAKTVMQLADVTIHLDVDDSRIDVMQLRKPKRTARYSVTEKGFIIATTDRVVPRTVHKTVRKILRPQPPP